MSVAPAFDVAEYRPPFVLVSDMLFAVTLARTADLRNAFPGVPFLALLGWTPLVVWFSGVTEIRYQDAQAQAHCEQDPAGIYRELNVMALLRRRAVFVPAIYATEQRTVAIARTYYGMPKQVGLPDASFVCPRLGPIRLRLPRMRGRRTWPVHFPSGTSVRVLLHGASHIKLAWLARGQLSLATAWLPRPRPFLPLGLQVTRLTMELPTTFKSWRKCADYC